MHTKILIAYLVISTNLNKGVECDVYDEKFIDLYNKAKLESSVASLIEDDLLSYILDMGFTLTGSKPEQFCNIVYMANDGQPESQAFLSSYYFLMQILKILNCGLKKLHRMRFHKDGTS